MRRRPSAPSFSSAFALRSDSAVELEPAPPMTGIRPATRSMTVLATSRSSSSVIVEDSPVVPKTRMPSVPFSRWKSTRRSSDP